MGAFFISQQKFDDEIARLASEICDHITAEMGAELHDDLIQKLSVIGLHLDRLDRSSHNRDELEKLLILMRVDFDLVVKSVRGISRKLMPVQSEGSSFQETIRVLCHNMEGPGFGNIHFEHTGIEQSIPSLSKNYLYRIIQELIHNSFKHSSAWHIWVRLNWNASGLLLEVEDDGTGFHKISEFIERLRKKHNTLKMRSQVIGAKITYHHGKKGLLAKVALRI